MKYALFMVPMYIRTGSDYDPEVTLNGILQYAEDISSGTVFIDYDGKSEPTRKLKKENLPKKVRDHFKACDV